MLYYMDIKKGFMIFALGMFLGIISGWAYNYNVVLGVLGYFITVIVIICLAFKDDD